ncbi:PAS domain-containing protein [Aquimarina muelleri]|uniref:PAS domain-containing protein n=1 Tax=Aquimarina muelleri TaxID=279356 RepID=A0A918N287_9FLAO|nr:PAS domain-containing protein [Aquimarina muelleri]MCX2761956.1 PAS domain-containing protein [Aquimarina muelleri]GGX10654.1 hypothetical protein GCM10007384_10480 [Aquimarina muelleri]
MNEFFAYDSVMDKYYKKMSNHVLPLLSWEFYGEHHKLIESFRDDFVALKKVTKNWSFNIDYKQFIEEDSVIVVTNPKLKIVFASQNIQKMNGYLPEEVIGNSPKMFQGDETCIKTSITVRKAIDSMLPFEVSILNYRKDQTSYMCLIKGFPVHDKQGRLVNYIAFEKAA